MGSFGWFRVVPCFSMYGTFSGEKIHVDVFTLIYEYFENFLQKIGYVINETWHRNGNIKDVTFTFTKIGDLSTI